MSKANSASFLLAAYDTERLKTPSVWSSFPDGDLRFRPAPLARTPLEHMAPRSWERKD